jgi:hypothetical protein
MEQLLATLLTLICLGVPFIMLVLVGAIYLLSMGTVTIPGIARQKIIPSQHWITVSEFTRKTSETIAAITSILGVIFGLVGFFLPWVQVSAGATAELGALDLDLGGVGGVSGSLTGIAVGLYALVGGVSVLSAGLDQAPMIGIVLILIAAFIGLILLVLVICAFIGLGIASAPLKMTKINTQRLSRILLIVSTLALCLVCVFFAALQATVGGIDLGGSSSVIGFSVGVSVATGFWITVGGLILAMTGGSIAVAVAGPFSEWADKLGQLEPID